MNKHSPAHRTATSLSQCLSQLLAACPVPPLPPQGGQELEVHGSKWASGRQRAPWAEASASFPPRWDSAVRLALALPLSLHAKGPR